MPRPKPAVEPISILLRLHPSVLAAVDRARGKTSRAGWITGCISRDLGGIADLVAPNAPVGPASRSATVDVAPRQVKTVVAGRKPVGFTTAGEPIYR